MRSSTGVLVLLAALAACTDVRDFRGEWRGPRVGDDAALRVGVDPQASAILAIDSIDKQGLAGRLTVDGLAASAPLVSIRGAEADALAGVTWTGSPLRVYLAFVPASDGGGDLLAVIALFDRRVEARLLRGGTKPVYAIFALTSGAPEAPP
jgi:hypothetical protein